MQLDMVVAGHITIDVNVFPHGIVENMLGGTPTYAGFALTTLGRETGVISKIGEDFPEQFPPLFSKFGLNTEGILATSEKTTKFENTYADDGSRKQICKEVSPEITPDDVPNAYLNAEGFYLSPVMGEIPLETVAKISEKGEGITMLDPQGILREVKNGGKIVHSMPENFQEYLEKVDIVKVGMDELEIFDKPNDEVLEELVEIGPEIAILTLGGEGCKILFDENIRKIKSIDVNVEDPTGAGDVFGSTFLSKYIETGNPLDSAKFASAAAGLKIEYKGPTGFPSEEETLEALES